MIEENNFISDNSRVAFLGTRVSRGRIVQEDRKNINHDFPIPTKAQLTVTEY